MMKFAVVLAGLTFSAQSFAFTNFTLYKCQSQTTGLQLEAIPEFGEVAIANAAGETIQQIEGAVARIEALSTPASKKVTFVQASGETVLVVNETSSAITAEYQGDNSFICTK